MITIATITAQFASISAGLSSRALANPTNPTPTSFDWLTFLWGGAIGAFVAALFILGIERVLDWIISARNLKKAKAQIAIAMESEIQSNIEICNDLLKGYDANPGKIFPYHHRLSLSWIELYKSKYIDFTNKVDRDKYEQLDWFCKQIIAIEKQRNNLQLFDAFTQVTPQAPQQLASHNYQGITNYNKGIAVMTNELREKLKKFLLSK
jgi:hypothetical protein